MSEAEPAATDDVPPLEDMTEFVAKAKTVRTRREQQKQDAPSSKVASTSVPESNGKAKTESHAHSGEKSSQFGGMRKGFLFASAKEAAPQKKKKAASSAKEKQAKPSASSAAEEMPFIKPTEKKRGLELPEVQEAMKESLGNLGAQEWVTDDLLSKIKEHPVLSKAFQDPNMSQVMSQCISNPQAMMAAAQSNPEIHSFMKEFCNLMGDHFTKLADNQEQNEEEVEMRLQKPEVQKALRDPRIQELIATLKSDPDKAQNLLKSQGQEFHDNVKVLIDNGLLAVKKL